MSARPRRQAREAALQVLFASEASGGGFEWEAMEGVFDAVLDEFTLPPRGLERARELLRGVSQNLKTID